MTLGERVKSLTGPQGPARPAPACSLGFPGLPALARHTSATLASQLHCHVLREAALTALSPLESWLVPPSIPLLARVLSLRTSLCTTVILYLFVVFVSSPISVQAPGRQSLCVWLNGRSVPRARYSAE